ncbi:hypothetical protein SAMN05216391_11315 [Lachnospiraceae bacterium KHCPX20]|nr:hypothetical protein SAMN05216391_11315 [Lachnospiraceae bacterium KHCPX20]
MREIVHQYGRAVFSVMAFSLVISLLFGGLHYWGKVAQAARLCDENLLKAHGKKAEEATKASLSISEENIQWENGSFEVGEKYYYNDSSQNRLTIHGRKPSYVAVLSVFYCDRQKEWDVTGQVRRQWKERDEKAYLCFARSGCYRMCVYTEDAKGVKETWNIYGNVYQKFHKEDRG